MAPPRSASADKPRPDIRAASPWSEESQPVLPYSFHSPIVWFSMVCRPPPERVAASTANSSGGAGARTEHGPGNRSGLLRPDACEGPVNSQRVNNGRLWRNGGGRSAARTQASS